ncbi:MAG: histone deacetylase [Desulfobacterales bacterium]
MEFEKLSQTGIVKDARYLEHLTGDGHPESYKRLETIYAMLKDTDISGHFVEVIPRLAEKEEILLNHSPEYLKQVAATNGKGLFALSADTHTSEKSYKTALLAAGGVLKATEMVMMGKITRAFCLQRPPGHHAEKGRAMGFCIFNNVALGALYARKALGLKRVLIVDWDVHHGNGTQHSFETDPSTLFFSIHQFPHYPGTGLYTEVGKGKAEGTTVNVPLGKGYGDAEYAYIFEKFLKPVALEFGPDLILVSAGFDIHQSDPLGAMKVSTAGFAVLTRSVMTMANSCCGGKVVFCLEGGYNLEILRTSVKASLKELTGQTLSNPEEVADGAALKKVQYVLKRCCHVHQRFWKSLKNGL